MPTSKIVIESEGISKIKREADEAAKALDRLVQVHKEVTRQGGKNAEVTKRILNQQMLAIRERSIGGEDIAARFAATADPLERERLQRSFNRSQIGIQRIAAKGETLGAQFAGRGGAGGLMGRVAQGAGFGGVGGMMKGGGLAAGAFLAGMALKKLATTAKAASDLYVKHNDRLTDFSRGLATVGNGFAQFMSIAKMSGTSMRGMGFSEQETVGFAAQITGAGGLRGGSAAARATNLRGDVIGGGRLSRFFGMAGSQGAGLVGGLRESGFQGDAAGLLGGLGQRARAGGGGVFSGRIPQLLQQIVEFSKETATVLKNGEKKQSIDTFSKIMEGLGGQGIQFTGQAGKRIISSVNEVMQSGSGILGGMFARFLTARTAQQGGNQMDVLRKLDQGIFAEGGRPFVEMIQEIQRSSGTLDNVAVLLSKQTGRPLMETEAFLEAIKDLDTTTDEGLKAAREEFKAFKTDTEADRLRQAQAKMADAMLRFGESVGIFRTASILMGDVAGLLLRDERPQFLKSFRSTSLDEGLGVNRSMQNRLKAMVGKFGGKDRTLAQNMMLEGVFEHEIMGLITGGVGDELTPTGGTKVRFQSHNMRMLAKGLGVDKVNLQDEGVSGLLEAFRQILAEVTLTTGRKVEMSFVDSENNVSIIEGIITTKVP